MSGIAPRRRGSRRLGALLVVVLALVLAGCGSSQEPAAEGRIHGAELDVPYEASDLALRNTAGEPQALSDVDNDLTLVFFGYTRCPDICGIVMSTITSAVNQLDDDLRERVDMVFVTTDPARDDEQELRAYLDRYDPEFEGLTGDLEAIVEAGLSVKVAVEEGEKLPSGGYEVVHSDHVVGLDDQGLGRIVWTKEISATQMASDIETILTR